MAKSIMFQGTSSDVGKSIAVTGLCRILARRGLKVVPFKSQNMALNSYVTVTGDEMGRAQVAQAEAAKVEPNVLMNPVLLKPTGNMSSQVILMGKSIGTYSAREYHTKYSTKALDTIKRCLSELHANNDVIVIEGAGSPVEVNLKKNDIVNMRIAKMYNTPVILVTDIDRGGSIASIVGTLALLEEDERDLVKGIIINKFRGDITLLTPALDFIEEYTNKPVLGVLPYIDNLNIDEEDSVALSRKLSYKKAAIKIGVLQFPKISNFTDFDALSHEPDVNLRYIKRGEEIGDIDALILPGSKNTLADLQYLKDEGYLEEIYSLQKEGKFIFGICGGYQMLGKTIKDPHQIEGDILESEALGLLPITTSMNKVKHTYQANFAPLFDLENYSEAFKGYEIHMGETSVLDNEKVHSLFTITRKPNEDKVIDGLVSLDNKVWGTYLHGVFDNDLFRRYWLNLIRQEKGLEILANQYEYFTSKEKAYERLADIVEENLNMPLLDKILEESI